MNLDAGGSYSRDGGPLSYKWQGPFGIRTTQVVNLATPRDLPFGVDPILLAVTDSNGQTATDSLTVTVKDTTPPTITLSLSPSVLWPPNHKLVQVVATVNAHDSCDADPPSVELVSIVVSDQVGHDEGRCDARDEGADGRGDGSTSADVVDAAIGTDDRVFKLRAERSCHDRVYTVTYRATDLAGNQAEASAVVLVPHDQRKSNP